jgi:hypothetical protein
MFHRDIIEAEIRSARQLGDFRAVASLEGRLHENVSMAARLIGELPPSRLTVNLVTNADDWPELQSDLLTVARLVPAARQPLLQLVHKRAHITGVPQKTLEAADVVE